jgi:hypothetical protein
MHGASGVSDTACGVIDTACISKMLIYFANSNLYAKRLNYEPRADILMKKPRVDNACTIKFLTNFQK